MRFVALQYLPRAMGACTRGACCAEEEGGAVDGSRGPPKTTTTSHSTLFQIHRRDELKMTALFPEQDRVL